MYGVLSSHHGAPPSASSSSSSSSSPSSACSYDVAPRPPRPPPARTSRLSFAGMMAWMSCHQKESRGGTAGGLSSGRQAVMMHIIIEACHHPAWYHGGISGRLKSRHRYAIDMMMSSWNASGDGWRTFSSTATASPCCLPCLSSSRLMSSGCLECPLPDYVTCIWI